MLDDSRPKDYLPFRVRTSFIIWPIIVTILTTLLYLNILEADREDLVWGTFLGGSSLETAFGIALDSQNNVYVAGHTYSNDFPIVTGDFRTVSNEYPDIFIAKLSSTGSDLVFSTLIGGNREDGCRAIDVDKSGHAYVTGHTYSTDFPTTPSAYDTSDNGGPEVIVVKMDQTGSVLEYSTLLGGWENEWGTSICVDDSGCAYVTGHTRSNDFPTTTGAFDTSLNNIEFYWTDAFVTKLNRSGNGLIFSTFLGGARGDKAYGITSDDNGYVYITGKTYSEDFPSTLNAYDPTFNSLDDVFVTKLKPAGDSLEYSTFVGGSAYEHGVDIAIDAWYCAYVSGATKSLDFPTTPGAFDTSYDGQEDAFLFKLNPTGSTLLHSTFLGGDEEDEAWGVDVDHDGYVYVSGNTNSSNFPVSPGALDMTYNGQDAFFLLLDSTFDTLVYGTFLGGRGRSADRSYALAVNDNGNAYLTGTAGSFLFPITAGCFDPSYNQGDDVFVCQIRAKQTPVSSPSDVSCLIENYTLHPNYPNPFNAATEIRYQLTEEADVSLKIYNSAGQTVRTLVESHQPAGFHIAAWNGTDDDHQAVASGIYFCRLQAGNTAKTIKMALIR